MQLAKVREIIAANPSLATDLTLEGALRLLGNSARDQAGRSANCRHRQMLSQPAWLLASVTERRRFLTAIGLPSILEALPQEFREEFRRRAANHQGKRTSPHDNINRRLTTALKIALSTDNPGQAQAALEGIRSMLATKHFDLHDLNVVVEGTAESQAA